MAKTMKMAINTVSMRNDVLELVVKAEQAKAPLRLSKLLFDAHDRSSPLAVTVVSRCGPGPGAPYGYPDAR